MHRQLRLLYSLTAILIAVGFGSVAIIGFRPVPASAILQISERDGQSIASLPPAADPVAATAYPVAATAYPVAATAYPAAATAYPAAATAYPVAATAHPVAATAYPAPPSLQLDKPHTAWIDPALVRQWEEEPHVQLRVILILNSPETHKLSWELEAEPVQRRMQLVATKQTHLDQALRPLEPALANAARRGALTARRELWLVNALALTADRALIADLAAAPAVDRILLDQFRQYDLEPTVDVSDGMALDDAPWGLSRIRAPEVWQTLSVTGTGAVVAVMDTGVDWMHPELRASYRGNLGRGFYNHTASWYDAVNDSFYPYDDFGHGTHVIGTAVGSTTGVAPGATWIGVKVLSGEGYGYDSWILSGFQWLLAPGGEVALAPDIVNASWSSSYSQGTIFQEAIEALVAAGVFPVFAAGNEGPSPGSVGSPASNPGVFSVGASDPDEAIASFSSRGPSPWKEVKPAVIAPGVSVISALPGGGYGASNGTSMATPHVVGLGALMRSVSPTLSVQAMMRLITETARPLTGTLPSNASGWGRIDALDAVMALAHPARLTGLVQTTTGAPLSGARVAAYRDILKGPAPSLETHTDADGRYSLALASGLYTVTVSLFGYESSTTAHVGVVADEIRYHDADLKALPTGTVAGRVRILGSGAAPVPPVTVRARDTPVMARTDATGAYRLTLPAGSYQLEIRELGYRVVMATVSVVAGETTTRNFTLEPTAKLLLIDEGAWYYGSEIAYWQDALDSLGLTYDEIRIKLPQHDTPISETLHPYDIVLWSSPLGSPGLVGASGALGDYLDQGGRLLLSGQDIAYFDGGGPGGWGAIAPYLSEKLGVQYLAEMQQIPLVEGSGPFAGIQITLNGGDGADNQWLPDVVRLVAPQHTSPVWHFSSEDAVAGSASDVCVPYRALFLGFGFEAISDAAQRREIMARSLAWLQTPPAAAGLRAVRVTRPILTARPGDDVTHRVSVTHIGSAGITDTVQLTLEGGQWPAALSTNPLALGPCETRPVSITITIPPGTGIHVSDAYTLLINSDAAPSPVSVPLVSKSPAPVLVVDDDRWYPVEDHYIGALTARSIAFDLWDTHPQAGQTPLMASPTTETLALYPIVVWFTGYDWYAPILPAEINRITRYLDQGGRLLLSSQDYIYHHQHEPLTQRLGVLTHDRDATATRASGVIDHPAGGSWGPISLDYPFPNWSHTIEPAPDARPVIRGQLGQPVGIAAVDAASGASQSLFYALPLEALPPEARETVLERGIGWLSPLGNSEWHVSPTTVGPGHEVTFTLMLRNNAAAPVIAKAVHHVPVSWHLPTSVPPGTVLNASERTLQWSGHLQPDDAVTLIWTTSPVSATAEETRPLTVTLSLPAWDLHFEREAAFYGMGPDLSPSHWQVPDENQIRTSTPVSLTFQLTNRSPITLEEGSVTVWIMRGASPITATAPLTHGMQRQLWTGSLGPYEHETLTLPLRAWAWQHPVRLDALLEDHEGRRWEQRLWLTAVPWQTYLPTMYRTE